MQAINLISRMTILHYGNVSIMIYSKPNLSGMVKSRE